MAMMRPLHDLRVAAGFLTRVPVGDVSAGGTRAVSMPDAVPWFPVVGAVVGLIAGGVWRGAIELVTPSVAAGLAVAAALLVTGAFHHDGLADIADAFGGGWSVEQRFEILKDSRLGTYGTASLVVALLLEVAALASLSADDGLRALVMAHAIGRVASIVAMVAAPMAGDGMGAAYASSLSTVRVGVGAALGVAIAWVTSPVLIVWPVLASAVAAVAVVVLAIRKIGGVTGDVLGAITVCASLSSLIATVAAT